MHLYLLTRGIKKNVDHFINDMSAQYFPYTKDKDGKPIWVQMAMRPIQLWECVFPNNSLQEVMATMDLNMTEEMYKQRGITKSPGWNYGNKTLWMLRKLLKAKELPPLDPKAKKRIVFKDWVHIAPIGIKEDDIRDGKEML